MYEQLGYLILSLNILEMGAFISLFALSIGISYLLSNGKMDALLLINLIICSVIAFTMFVGYRESVYAFLVVIALGLIILIPDGTSDKEFRKDK